MRTFTIFALFFLFAPRTIRAADCGDWLTVCVCGDFVDISPCGNATVGEGCWNSTGVGAILVAQGCFSVSNDDVVLSVEQLPHNQFGIVFASYSSSSGQPTFGDGVLCMDAPYLRFPVHSSGPLGVFSEGPGIAQFAGIQPGDQILFQGWFRDPAGPCGSGFNLSSAILTTWSN